MNANSYSTGQIADVNRESLSNELTILEPEKTPFLSMVSKNTDATQTFHEVTADRLRAPRISGTREGDSGSGGGNKTTKRARFGAYLHRFMDEFSVTDVQEAVAKKGGTAGTTGSLYDQVKLKALREVKRDMEAACLSAQDTQGGSDTEMRMRGAFKWIAATQTPQVPADYIAPTPQQVVGGVTAMLESTLSGVLTSLSDQYGGSEEYHVFAGNTYCEDIDLFAVQDSAGGAANRYTTPVSVVGGETKTVSLIVSIFQTSLGRVVIHNDKFVNINSAGTGNGDAALVANMDQWELSMLEDLYSADNDQDAGGVSGFVKAIGGLFCKMPRGNAVVYGTLN